MEKKNLKQILILNSIFSILSFLSCTNNLFCEKIIFPPLQVRIDLVIKMLQRLKWTFFHDVRKIAKGSQNQMLHFNQVKMEYKW